MKIGYLVCTKCGSYYEIQPQDHPNEFSGKCECGGNIKFVRYNDFSDNARKIGASSAWEIKRKRDKGKLFINIIVGSIPFLLGLIGFYMIHYNWGLFVSDFQTGGVFGILVGMFSSGFLLLGIYVMCGGFASKKMEG